MNTHNLKRYMMPLFAFFIMLAGAKAADYLWEPKLLWESKESYERSIYGLQFINDDKEVLYSADGKNYVRDAQTGEILKQSEQFDMEMGSFRFSKDKKNIFTFGDATYLGQRKYKALLRFDAQTLKCLDSLPVFMKYLKTIYNEKELSIVSIDNYAVISDDRIIFLCSTREQGPEYPFYNYCLISFNPQKKDFSWDNKDDWKMEYYFVPKENSTSNPPIITRDSKYLIYETPSGVKILDLETLKDYWSIPGENISSITPNDQFILSLHNPGNLKIFNIADKSEILSMDSKALLESSNYKAGVIYKTNDPFKIFYGGSGYPYFDCSDKTVKFSFSPGLNMGIRYCDEKLNKFMAGKYNAPDNIIFMYSTNPTAGIGDHSGDDRTEYLSVSNNKLIIPINEIAPKEITIFNADGKLIKQFSTFDADKENIYLNVTFLNQGVYFVSVTFSNGNSVNYKFLKGE